MYTPFFASGKVIQSPQCGKFLLLGSGIQEFCLWDLKYGKFLLVGSGIRKILLLVSGIQEIFVCGIRNTGNFCLWDPEYGGIFVCGIRNTGNYCLWDPKS